MLTPKAVFVICLLSLTPPVVMKVSVKMRLLLSRENSTYVNIVFRDKMFQKLSTCMSMDSTVACSIEVTRILRRQEAFVINIQSPQTGVSDTLSSQFTCTYWPQRQNVVCSRLHTETWNPNTPHTSFRLRDPCCHKCVGLVWNDAMEQLIFDDSSQYIRTLEIDANCSLSVAKPEFVPSTTPFLNNTSHGQTLHSTEKDMATTTPFLNNTSHGQTLHSTVKDVAISAYDRGPSVIVATVVSGTVAVFIVVVCMFYRIRSVRGHLGDNIVEEKRAINTGSFRTLVVELPTDYVNTNPSRLYSGLEFVNGVTTDQHDYAKVEASVKSQNTDEDNTHNLYEETDLCKPTEVTNESHYINSLDTFNRRQLEDDGRTYSTIADSYAILGDLKDDSSEVNRLIKRCSTVETTYIDLTDESTDEKYFKADTESGNIHTNDSSRANIYANTEASVHEEGAEYTNVSPRNITIKL